MYNPDEESEVRRTVSLPFTTTRPPVKSRGRHMMSQMVLGAS